MAFLSIWWDLDDDDYPEPYTVTIHKESRKVVRVWSLTAFMQHPSRKQRVHDEREWLRPIPAWLQTSSLPAQQS